MRLNELLLEDISLNQHQKYVLLQIKTAETPTLAYERVSDDESEIKAMDMLHRYGFIKLSNEQKKAALTNKGNDAVVSYGLLDDMGEISEMGEELLKQYQ